ncbi:hypothetical protein BDY24DRAFT_377646 [Mrakia frigida]|uniref:uncharacterized protein n=1 Tax=Mrakia frigida TaxID=29902 RepID=UPI003FCBF826
MSAQIPLEVATQNELGVLTALRQLSKNGTVLPSRMAKEEAKRVIVGWYRKQTQPIGHPSWIQSWEGLFGELEIQAVKGGLACFSDEFIEARREVGLFASSVFPLAPSAIPSSIENQEELWNALKTAGDSNDAKVILETYIDAKLRRGKSAAEISTKLDNIEKRLVDAQISRWTNAIIQVRSKRSLPPSSILLANVFNDASTSTANFTATSLSVSFSSDLAEDAREAYKFLSRRAVDGYVESEREVLAALGSRRTKNEKGRAELLLQGFCDHNRRNQHNVEERLDRLEVEMRAKKLLDFAADIYETRFLLHLPPSKIFPFTPPPPPLPSLAQPPTSDLDSLLPVFREAADSDAASLLPAYERTDPEVRASPGVVGSAVVATRSRDRSGGNAGAVLETGGLVASSCIVL